jgi:hypothetical protein
MSRLRWGASGGGGKRSPLLGFVPYHELAGRPNVVVDGSPTTGTVLCLSHWPGIASPPGFQADLSAQMAFAYLEAYDRHDPATAVSNNHGGPGQPGALLIPAGSGAADGIEGVPQAVRCCRASGHPDEGVTAATRASREVKSGMGLLLGGEEGAWPGYRASS